MVETAADDAIPQQQKIRCIVVDDHDLFRTGLVTLLSDAGRVEVVGQASGGRAGVRLARELRPDVVLMDIRMPDTDGPEATRQIIANDPDARVLALTVASDEADVAAAIDAGVCGFLAKDTPLESLVVAIQAAATGAAWLSPRAAEVVLARLRGAGMGPARSLPALGQLSAREVDVLRLLAEGKENVEIAQTLSISPRTAKNHVSNILAKLSLPSRVQAAVFAVRQGVS